MKFDLYKKKYRWKFSADFPGATLAEQFVKIDERPTLHIVEKENSDGSFRIEKQSWAPLVTTFYDPGTTGPQELKCDLTGLYTLLAGFYDFGACLFKTDDPSEKLEEIKDRLGTGKITMYDGETPIEIWELRGLWPHSVNFGDLCYSSSDETEIEITWRFKECSYHNLLTPAK
jgi:hypothetical protein